MPGGTGEVWSLIGITFRNVKIVANIAIDAKDLQRQLVDLNCLLLFEVTGFNNAVQVQQVKS